MRAILLNQFGPAENLQWEEVREPRPGPLELLVRVGACGVSCSRERDLVGKLVQRR
jgi:NADPH:quinone reductase-like Zn-dependent oxidoreductase